MQDRVVDDSVTVLDVDSDLVEAVGVGITGGLVALWCCPVAIPAPRREEGGEVSVRPADSDGMVAVEGVRCRLPMSRRDRHGLLERRHV